MTLDTVILLFGVLTGILPYLGVPSAWDTPLYTFFGIVIVACGIALRRGKSNRITQSTAHFVDSQLAERQTADSHE